MDVAIDPLGQIFLGLTLAATAGLRAWLPLLVVSILAYSNALVINSELAWLASPNAIAILVIATSLEILADKIPALDNLLDSFSLLIKPIAGALVMSSTITFTDPVVAIVLGIAAGGIAAETVEVGKLGARLVANATTVGMAAPVISVGEDAAAVTGITLAFVMPYVIGAIVLIILAILLWNLPRLWRRRRKASETASDG